MRYHPNYGIVMTRVAYQSNICDPSWRINHLGTTLQSRLAHRLAYRQLLMSRPHLINRIWFRCNCRTICVYAHIIGATRDATLTNKFITMRGDISSRQFSCVDTSVRFVSQYATNLWIRTFISSSSSGITREQWSLEHNPSTLIGKWIANRFACT